MKNIMVLESEKNNQTLKICLEGTNSVIFLPKTISDEFMDELHSANYTIFLTINPIAIKTI